MKRYNGFTLIELLVVIAVIAVLMAILMPALNRAREQGKRACCLSNLKQLQLAWTMYYDEERWWDPVPLRHGKGTTFSFADVHAEYRKWSDLRTIEIAEKELKAWTGGGYHDEHPDNEDLRWVQRGVWGKLGYKE